MPFIYLLFLLMSILFSQDYDYMDNDYGRIEGQVLFEDTGLPVESATVTLLLSNDLSIVNGTITDPIGSFQIKDIAFEQYDLIIDFLGYEKYTLSNQTIDSNNKKINLGIIMLSAKAVQVEEVSIESEKSFQQNKIDKKVYNTDVLGNTKGGDATDILEQIPSVTVDIDGNINLRGNSDVTILIDGRKTNISIEAISSEMIEKVEVMTTPSAKYDPDGTSGIINLILRKNEFIGTTGKISLNFAELFPEYNQWHQYGIGGNLNYFEKRWNLFSSFKSQSNRKYGSHSRTTVIYNGIDTLATSSSEVAQSNVFPKNDNIKIGIEYYPNTSSTIAFDLTFLKYRKNEIENLTLDYPFNIENYSLYDGDRESLDYTIDTWEKGEDLNYGFGYFLDFDEDHNLSLQLDYDDHNELELVNYSSNSELVEAEGNDRIFSIDYTLPIGQSFGDDKKSQIEIGLKHQLIEDQKNQFYNLEPYTFDYEQDQLSTYLNLAFYFSDIFGMQFGSRFESSKTNSTLNHNIDNSEESLLNNFEWAISRFGSENFNYNYNYDRIYPSLFFLYDKGRKGTYKFEFGRRINRPWERTLNPFPDVSSEEFIYQGNPYLEPEDVYKWEVSYSNMTPIGYLNIGLFSSEITNQIDRHKYAGIDGYPPVLTWINKSRVDGRGLEFQLMTRLPQCDKWEAVKGCDLMFSGSYWNNNTTEADDESMLGEESGFWGYLMSKFKLENNQEVQLSGYFSTPMKINNGEISPMYSVGLTYKKDISDKFNISLSVKDLFDTKEFHIITNNSVDGYNEYLEATHKRDKRKFVFSIDYKFGEFKKKKYIRGSGPSYNPDSGGGMSY